MNNTLKAKRIAEGLTQSAVAQYLDTSVQNYSQKELGLRLIKLSEAKKLAVLFNTTVEELFPESTGAIK